MVYILLQYLGVGSFAFMHWLLAIAITLLLLDVFVQTDVLSIISVFIFAEYAAGFLCNIIPIQWYIAIYILILMAAFYLYAIIWRKIVYNLLKKTLLRNAAAESYDNMAGEEGVFRKIENREFVFWNGELWQVEYSSTCNFRDGEKIHITKNHNGKLTIIK